MNETNKKEFEEQIQNIIFTDEGDEQKRVDNLWNWVKSEIRQARIDENKKWLRIYEDYDNSDTMEVKFIIKEIKYQTKQLEKE